MQRNTENLDFGSSRDPGGRIIPVPPNPNQKKITTVHQFGRRGRDKVVVQKRYLETGLEGYPGLEE